MLSRRALVGKLAAGITAMWAVGGARRSVASVHASAVDPTGATGAAGSVSGEPAAGIASVAPSAAPPWELIQPWRRGAMVAHGWQLNALSAVVDGACVLTLRHASGHLARVHLCRNDGHPQGIVQTNEFDLVLMNGGQGDRPTDESLAHAVTAVAQVLTANQSALQVRKDLWPHAERVRQFAGVVERRLR